MQEATVKRLRERKEWQPNEKNEEVSHTKSASIEELEALRDIEEETAKVGSSCSLQRIVSQQYMQLEAAAVDTESEQDESDSELEEEQNELESEKNKMDRQFQRANQKHARTLRRIDSDIESKSVRSHRMWQLCCLG